jgi:hypothetical protein
MSHEFILCVGSAALGGIILAAGGETLQNQPTPMDDRRKAEAIAAARREIARRIARFCTSLSPEEFEKLLDRMAQIHWKYEVFPYGEEVAGQRLRSRLSGAPTPPKQDTLS